MPKLTVVERNGKLIVVSQTEMLGGPADSYIAVRDNKHYEVFENQDDAKNYLTEHEGTVYFLTHYWHNDGWLPKVYRAERYGLV